MTTDDIVVAFKVCKVFLSLVTQCSSIFNFIIGSCSRVIFTQTVVNSRVVMAIVRVITGLYVPICIDGILLHGLPWCDFFVFVSSVCIHY